MAELKETAALTGKIGEKKVITQEEFDEMKKQNNGSFTNMVFESVDFQNIAFSNVIFKRVSFNNCKFKVCNFQNIAFEDVSFRWVNFYRNVFTKVKMFHINFYYCNLPNSVFLESTLVYIFFAYSLVGETLFERVNMTEINANCCNFEMAMFVESEIDRYAFSSTNTTRCEAIETQIVFPNCVPSHGSFVAWKKAIIEDGPAVIIKLRVPEDAIRYSPRHKCRANKVEILGYETLDGEKLPETTKVHSWWDSNFYYKIGTIEVKNFDADSQRECSSGIHFFLNRQDAVNYQL